MDDFSAHVRAVFRTSLFFLSISFLGVAFLPEYRSYFFGFIVGLVISIVNSQYLSWKIRQLTEAVVHKTNRRINMGFITRASLSLLAILISLKYEHIEFSTTLAGLFFVQLATLLLGIFSIGSNRK
jgi:ATP synthase protein I